MTVLVTEQPFRPTTIGSACQLLSAKQKGKHRFAATTGSLEIPFSRLSLSLLLSYYIVMVTIYHDTASFVNKFCEKLNIMY